MELTNRESAVLKGSKESSGVSAEKTEDFDSFSLKPLLVIEPSNRWVPLRLSTLWEYRELLYFLTWRDVKVRYKQTVLGVAWAVIQPLTTMIVFTLFFGRLAGIPSDGVPYPVFAFAGLLPWTYFANAVTNSSNSLIGDSRLITKVYFPRMIIPMASVGAGLVDFVISLFLLILLMWYYGLSVDWQISIFPLLVLQTILLALAVGTWMAALNLKYRDVRYALPFLIQIWMFASPIIYPSTIVPEKWKWLLFFNPMSGLVEGFRASLFVNKPMDWMGLGISAIATLILLVVSLFSFRRMEKSFADIV